MDTFQLWKLATDVALILSVLYLSARFIRSQGAGVDTRELRDLEIVLKNLLKDADTASHALSDSLGRRQQSLERVLEEISSSERRIAASLRSADELRAELQREVSGSMERPARRVREAAQSTAVPPAAPNPPAPTRAARIPLSQRVELAAEQEEHWTLRTEPQSQPQNQPSPESRRSVSAPEVASAAEEADMEQPRRTGAAAYRSIAKQQQTAVDGSSRYNIFGEPLESAAPQGAPARPARPRLPRQPLADEVEIERIAPPQDQLPPPRPRDQAEIRDIHEAAARLLQAGEDIETVAAATRLPLNEVRAIMQRRTRPVDSSPATQQSIARTPMEAPPADPTADPRLGVFASIRRQTQVL